MKRIRGILQRNLKLAAISAAMFAAGIPLGLLIYPLVADKMPKILQEAFGGIMDGPDWLVIVKVFLRNVSASAFIMLLSTTLVIGLLTLLANGLVVGLVFTFASHRGLDVGRLVLGLIPHGIFEMPALFLSSALGMRVGLQVLTQKGRRIQAASEAIKEASAAYITMVMPLLAVAAVMEILVSKNLIR